MELNDDTTVTATIRLIMQGKVRQTIKLITI